MQETARTGTGTGESISETAKNFREHTLRPLIFSLSRRQENLLGCVGQRAVWLSREGMSLYFFSRKAEDVKKCATREQASRGTVRG